MTLRHPSQTVLLLFTGFMVQFSSHRKLQIVYAQTLVLQLRALTCKLRVSPQKPLLCFVRTSQQTVTISPKQN